MEAEETTPLLPAHLPAPEPDPERGPHPAGNEERKLKPYRSHAFGIAMALFGKRLGFSGALRQDLTVGFVGVFLASADDSLVYATYGTIASHFEALSDGPLLLTGYTLGYCVALPVVSQNPYTAAMELPVGKTYSRKLYVVTASRIPRSATAAVPY